uniref:MATa pheromone n=6 Tax=Cryptococcus neoformans species complex TaxID=1897064 RepID=Q7LS96_9TREE|nr:MATa pheromone [Cryptococcus neoformans var. neoformans]AAK21952.1 MATa pheromone [Cryptococcus neoformans var. neoformans]AAK21953.1 MATa pheromone [Cryptococcus neoformans var. neoformans]AAN75621.1 MFa1 [Cryptococcus neoformans var. neoformans]AAN75622.1 MFa3 [Cryptococcus neoformans var. neoformans]
MDAFTAIFSTLSSSVASSTTDAPRNEEAYGSGQGPTYSCVIA